MADPQHATETHDEPHGSADHGTADGHHDAHGSGGDALGPIDWGMWAVGVFGVLIGVVVAALVAVSVAPA